MSTTKKSLISITDEAVAKIKDLMGKRAGGVSIGIRVDVKAGGCSGLSYHIEYADEVQTGDEIVESQGIKIIIPPRAVMYLVGTTMDYTTTDIKSGFIFKNPNEKSQCGCGESFSV